ncbi:MAG TPA: hypothetical protein PLI09_08995 [Candidatus Hydrogenedentes bacterium]|nr:hypothetical protein [Candidatus Hydrogenedentota bacterium]
MEPEPRKRSWAVDGGLAITLFLIGAFAGGLYNATWGGVPQFWQNTTFMQAIMYVCGHGFENPMVPDVPGLDSFLEYKTDCFDCAAIPPNVRVLPHDTSSMSFEEIDAYHPQEQFPGFLAWQRYHLYLVWAVLGCWWLFGVCWSALTPLCGLLYGTTVAAVYGLFRLGMRRGLAVLGALLIALSPLHLQMIPHLRDYAKAPFLLLVLLIMGYLVKHSPRWWKVLGMSILCGAILGLGVGFRTDLGIAFPAFFVILLLMRARWITRFFAAAFFTLAFIGAGYPILLEVFKEAGHFCHVALLGFLAYCDDRLGVGSALYTLGGPYSDFYIANVVQSYMQRIHGSMPPTHVMMPEYHEATQLYFMEYLKTFPGDLVVRGYTSVLRVLDEMHPDPSRPWPMNITNQFLCRLYEWRSIALDHIPGGGRYFALAALILIACADLRWAFAALFLLLYFAGYPAIQFNLRHAFQFEFISLWTIGFLLQRAWSLVSSVSPHQSGDDLSNFSIPAAMLRAAAFVVIAALGLSGLLAATCAYQHFTVGNLISKVETRIVQRLAYEPQLETTDTVLLRLPGIPAPDPAKPVQYEYLMVELKGAFVNIPVTFAYEAEDREHFDYTRTVNVRLGQHGGPTRLYFPLYFSPQSRFTGIRMPQRDLDRLAGIFRVTNADPIPLWLTLTLPSDWKDQPRHQRLTR